MSRIKTVLTMGDWTVNQGLVGYVRILKAADKQVELTHDGVVLDIEHLETFAQDFFQYYIGQYNVANREKRRLAALLQRLVSSQSDTRQKKPGSDKDTWKNYTSAIKTTSDNVAKYFSDYDRGIELIELAGHMREHEPKYSEELHQLTDRYIELLRTPEINNKLTANVFKGSVLNSYHGQVSFLNVSNNSKSIEEQVQIFHTDYIIPAIEEQRFIQLLGSACTDDEIISWLKKCQHKGLASLAKNIKKINIDDIRAYLETSVNRCNVFDQYYAFDRFDEGTFSPIAISSSNINFTWGASGGHSVPISATAKLILFCASAGATISSGKSCFVHMEGTFSRLMQVNDAYFHAKSKNKAFDEIIFDLVKEQEAKAKHTSLNYLLVEYSSEYKSKKTLLDYMVLTPALCRLFINHSNDFTYLNFMMRDKFTYELLNYRDPKYLILEQLREKNKHQYPSLDIVYASMIRYCYLLYKNGGDMVDKKKESKKIWSLYKSGYAMQQKIGDTKARSTAYRLLNAVRAGDKQMFRDTVMRMYISIGESVPQSLLIEGDVDFATAAQTWIGGLIANKEEGQKAKGADEGEQTSINHDGGL